MMAQERSKRPRVFLCLSALQQSIPTVVLSWMCTFLSPPDWCSLACSSSGLKAIAYLPTSSPALVRLRRLPLPPRMSSLLPLIPNNALRPARVEFERDVAAMMAYPDAVLRELDWVCDLRLPILRDLILPELSHLTRLHTLRVEVLPRQMTALNRPPGAVFPASLTRLIVEPSPLTEWHLGKARPTLPIQYLLDALPPTLLSVSLLGCVMKTPADQRTDRSSAIDEIVPWQQYFGTALQVLELPKRHVVGPLELDQLAMLPHLSSLLAPGGLSLYRSRWRNFVPAFLSLRNLATRFHDEQSALVMANVKGLQSLELYGRTAMRNLGWLRDFRFLAELTVSRLGAEQIVLLGAALIPWTFLVRLTVRLPPPRCDWQPLRRLLPSLRHLHLLDAAGLNILPNASWPRTT